MARRVKPFRQLQRAPNSVKEHTHANARFGSAETYSFSVQASAPFIRYKDRSWHAHTPTDVIMPSHDPGHVRATAARMLNDMVVVVT